MASPSNIMKKEDKYSIRDPGNHYIHPNMVLLLPLKVINNSSTALRNVTIGLLSTISTSAFRYFSCKILSSYKQGG